MNCIEGITLAYELGGFFFTFYRLVRKHADKKKRLRVKNFDQWMVGRYTCHT